MRHSAADKWLRHKSDILGALAVLWSVLINVQGVSCVVLVEM
jgi:hypothetical protein